MVSTAYILKKFLSIKPFRIKIVIASNRYAKPNNILLKKV